MTQSGRRKPHLARVLLSVTVICLVFAIYAAIGTAHGPTYQPPPPPPWDRLTLEFIRDLMPPPLTPYTPGPAGPNGHAGTPAPAVMPTAPKGQGGMTRKSRGATSTQVTWELWWARNRYRYLAFPNIADSASGMYPVTFDQKGKDTNGKAAISAMRQKSFAIIRPLLDHDSARLRRAALISLGRLNDSASHSRMTRLLKDGNQTVRDSVILALGIMNNREARHCLLHMARGTPSACTTIAQSSVPDYFRGFAVISLALGRSPEVSTVLKSVAKDPDTAPDVQAMALEGIGLVGGEGNAQFLMKYVDEGRASQYVLGAAVTALGKTAERMALPFLKKCLFSNYMPVRQSAALGLGNYPDGDREDLVKSLHRTYRHTNDLALRGFSLISMGLIGGPEALQYLDQVLLKGSASDRPWACLGLGFALRDTKNERGCARLRKTAFSHANRSTRGAAVIALGLVKDLEAINDLLRTMKEADDPTLRGYSAMALGMIGDMKTAGAIRRALRDDAMPQVKTQAATALALMNDTGSFPDLVELLITSPNDSIKSFAALSLGFMGDMGIVEDVHKRMEGGKLDDLTTAYCIRLMSRLLSGRTAPYLEPLAAGSNFASEFPLVDYLLNFGI